MAVYIGIGCSWILLSDWISFADADLEAARWFQTVKGLAYVLVTAAVLFALIRHYARRMWESEARFRLLVEQAPDAVLVQCGGRVVYANGAAVRLLGAPSQSSLLGREVLELIHPSSREAVRQDIVQAEENSLPVLIQEETFQRLDGGAVVCEVSAVPARYEGRRGSIVFVRDATARVQALERKMLGQKMETIRKLAGGLAHDFNNLLQVINGYTDLACEALPDDAQGRCYLEQVRMSGQRASDLVGQLLTFSSNPDTRLEALTLDAMGTGTLGLLRQVSGGAAAREPAARSSETVVVGEVQPAARREASGGRVVLIAEDDVTVRKLTARMLSRAGYSVLEAEDGAVAVQRFSEHAPLVQAVVLDIVMPRMGGFEAYDRIRALDPRVPILFASGFSGFSTPSHIELTPGVNLLQKPFEGRVLVTVLQRLMGASAGATAAAKA